MKVADQLARNKDKGRLLKTSNVEQGLRKSLAPNMFTSGLF